MCTCLLITALVFSSSWLVLTELWRFAPIRRRHDHEALWMAAIPTDDQSRVDELLSANCDAFLIPHRYRFRLRPSDDVHTFYHRNVRGQLADSLEYVHLMRRLEQGFGLDGERLLTRRPCTVGTLVRCVTKPRSQRTTARSANE